MNKKIDYNSAKTNKKEEKINKILNAQFEVPEEVKKAKEEAFAKIKIQTKKTSPIKQKKRYGRIIYKSVAALGISAAVFSVICIANPAWASEIPLLGSVFEKIGSSLGFSGDYEKYATSLENEELQDISENTEKNDIEDNDDNIYSKTSNGVTVSMSEVYCNDTALNLALTIQTEDTFPETFVTQSGIPSIKLEDETTEMKFSYNPEFQLYNAYLDGKMVDKHTYAGVLRVNMNETNANEQEIPDEFTIDLNIKTILGALPEDMDKTPEMPQDLIDQYQEAMKEHGLEEENYENFTEEEKEIEHQLFTEMWNQYYERYPEVSRDGDSYSWWKMEGEWDFSIPVKKDHTDTITKEINLVDENGSGIVSITKSPFEIQLNEENFNPDYFFIVLDADGEPLDYGNIGGVTNIFAIQDRDVSKVYIYMCDYIEYMDEIKGYYWSEDYEEKKKTKTYKEYLDEKSIMNAEVEFESDR